MKYFCEADKNYKVVCAGSLLCVKANRFNSSFPVGKVIIKYMFPMDFEEFLWAKGRDKLSQEIKECFEKRAMLIEGIYEICMNEYREYLCIGGMPGAILNYLQNDCSVIKFDKTIHENIITSYIADMRKYVYSPEESIKIQSIYETMPIQLGKKSRKFKYSIIKKNTSKREYDLPLDWLISSNMLIKCTKINTPQVPLNLIKLK